MMRPSQRRLVTSLLGLAALHTGSGCQIVGGYKSFSGHPCNVLPSSKLDPSGLATLVLSKQPDGTCYWIDKTEVTVEQYSAFLTKHAQPTAWDSTCSWKTEPSDPMHATTDDTCVASTSSESEPFRATKPIRCIDWCDARAFCNWAGGDLCGGTINGGAVEPQDLPDEWGEACSADGLPYVNGAMPVLGLCNSGVPAGQCLQLLKQYDCGAVDVSLLSGCVGPSGTVDMIGNVAEWVISCGYSDGGPDTLCQYRGGSFVDTLDAATCYGLESAPRVTRARTIGLRCCNALTPEEQSRVR